MAQFKYWQSTSNHQWFWHLLDGNNRKIADSAEGYSTEQAVIRAINNVVAEIKRM